MTRAASVLAAVAVAFAALAPSALGASAAALVPPNSLLLFDTATPGATTSVPVSGLGANETLRGIDQRPATLELYGSTVTTGSAANSVIRTYRIDPATGVATLLGTTAAALAGAADVPAGYDFNPFIDRIRYVNANDENSRLNPENAALAGNDTDLTPAATTTVIAEAYDRNRNDAEVTTLYAIDRNDSQLAIQGGIDGIPSPNGGVVTDLHPLGFSLNPAMDGGLDVDRDGTMWAALADDVDDLARLYTRNQDGDFVRVGKIGSGATQVRSLAILNARPAAVAAPAPAPALAPPPLPAAAPDRERPSGHLLFDRSLPLSAFLRSGLRGSFACSEMCRVSARLVLGKLTLARTSATLAGAAVGRLVLRASAAGRKALRGRRRVSAVLRATLTDPSGNVSTLSHHVGLR